MSIDKVREEMAATMIEYHLARDKAHADGNDFPLISAYIDQLLAIETGEWICKIPNTCTIPEDERNCEGSEVCPRWCVWMRPATIADCIGRAENG